MYSRPGYSSVHSTQSGYSSSQSGYPSQGGYTSSQGGYQTGYSSSHPYSQQTQTVVHSTYNNLGLFGHQHQRPASYTTHCDYEPNPLSCCTLL